MLTEALAALAAAGGTAVVSAMATDTWESVKAGLGRMFGRGDGARAAATEHRLERAKAELAVLSGVELERAGDAQAAAWRTRLADLLEDHPEVADQVRTMIAQVQASKATVTAGDHAVAVGGDVTMEATGGGVAAVMIEGSVLTNRPPSPGPDRA